MTILSPSLLFSWLMEVFYFHIACLAHLPYLWNSHSLLQRGHATLVLSHLEMQWKWKAWLQTPQAVVHSSAAFATEWAWQSMQGSIIWFLQMAQLSTWISKHKKIRLCLKVSTRCIRRPTFISLTYPMTKEQRRSIFSLQIFLLQLRIRPYC